MSSRGRGHLAKCDAYSSRVEYRRRVLQVDYAVGLPAIHRGQFESISKRAQMLCSLLSSANARNRPAFGGPFHVAICVFPDSAAAKLVVLRSAHSPSRPGILSADRVGTGIARVKLGGHCPTTVQGCRFLLGSA